MAETDVKDFIRRTIEEKQITDRIFRHGSIESIVFREKEEEAVHFLSIVHFATIHFENGVRVPILAKVPAKKGIFQGVGNFVLDVFANEWIMYSELLPKLNDTELTFVPECYYSCAENADAIVILEDLMNRNYKILTDSLLLDAPHMFLALEKIGQFHGLGYNYKKNSVLEEKCRELKKLKFSRVWLDFNKSFLQFYLIRQVKKLMNEAEHKTLMENFFEKISNVNMFVESLTAVQEPFATIIHGDFNKSNMAFLHDSQNHPTDVIFFDLQHSAYGDPCLDLAFFLYLNTDQTFRDNHWSECLTAYWRGVTNITRPDGPGFTFQEFQEHFNRRAVIGYVEPAFYIPTSLEPEKAISLVLDWALMSEEERVDVMDKMGGQKACNLVTDVLRDMIVRQYVDKYLSSLQ